VILRSNSETFTYWQIIMMHQQKVFPAMNKDMLKKPFIFRGLPSCMSWIQETGWPNRHSINHHTQGGWRKFSSVCYIWLFWTIIFCSNSCGGKNISQRFLYSPCIYNMLAQPGQELQVQRPFRRPSTARYVGRQGSSAVSIDLYHLNKYNATYVQLKE